MVKVILSYDFNESSKEGRDSIHVKTKKFEFEVKLKKSEYNMTINELHDKYYKDALHEAAYRIRCNSIM